MALLSHDELQQLTPPERLALIGQLWDSLGVDELQLSAAQKQELDRRLAALDDTSNTGVDWSTLKAELEI